MVKATSTSECLDMKKIYNSFRLAAIALLYLDQEDAFWCLVAIVEIFMPHDYYTKTLLGSQVPFSKMSLSRTKPAIF